MLSKNNYKERLRKMEQKKERFSIRKFSVGAASVLIGFFFMGVGSQTTVHAETVAPQVQTTKINNDVSQTEAKVDDTKAPTSEAVKPASSASEAPASSTASNANSEATSAASSVAKEKDTAKDTTKTLSVKDLENEKASAKQLGESKATTNTAVATHANGTGGYTQNGITVPPVTEPEASEFWKEFNQEVHPMSKEELAKLGLDENTFYESATNNTKWHAVSWLYLHNPEKQNINLGTFLYHNQDGTVAVIGVNNENLATDITNALSNAKNGNNNFGDYDPSQKAYLVPIISSTATIYVNKGVALTYDDIKRAFASNPEASTGLVSGNWVTDEQGQGVKVVNVNEPGLQEGAVRLSYVNGTKTSASINVDVVDLQGQTTYINVNGTVPGADTLISGQPAGSKDIKWITTPDVTKTGVTTGRVQVTYPDGSIGTATVTFDVEDPKGQDITVHVGQEVTPNNVVVPGTYPTGSTITWVQEPNLTTAGKTDASVVVTYPGSKVSSHVIPVSITVVAPEGKDITTPNGKVPSAQEGIGNVPEMPEGTTYTWKDTPEVKTPGTKPAVVVVTFPDGKSVDVPVKVTVENPVPTGKDITTPNGKVPEAQTAIGNVPDMPTGTTYNWKTTPEVKTPGTKPAVVVVTFPDGKSVDVPVKVTVENPVPQGQDVHTPEGVVPDPSKGISNVPDMPTGTKYEWKDVPEVNTPGTKPAVVVVTFPDGNTVDVPVTIVVDTPTPNTPVPTDPTPQGQDIHTPQGVVPDPSKGISNVPDMPTGTKYEWKDIPEVNTPGTHPAVVVVTFPDGNTVDVPITIVVEQETPVAPKPTEPKPQGQDIHTPQGKLPDPSEGIKNKPELPGGTKYEWKDVPEVNTPGTHPAVIVVTYPDGKTVEVPVNVIVDTPDTPQETPVAPKPTEPKPQGQDIHTPQGKLPDPSEGISNKPELPGGTKYEWKDVPEVNTPGTHPAVIVVTYPDGKTVEVPVNVIVEPKEEVAPVHASDVDTPKKATPVKPVSEKTSETPANSHEVVAPVKSTHVTLPKASAKKTTDYVDAHTKALPQTGAKEESTAAMLGIVIASVSAIIGLAAEKKRRN